VPLAGPQPPERFSADVRWPGVLRRELGSDWWVVEEGLNGRTTVWEDALEPYRNGLEYLRPALLSHQPLDVVVVMLGTNDLKRRFGVSAREIAVGAGLLVDAIRASGCGPDAGAPRVLLVCPPPLGRLDELADQFEGGAEKSRELAGHYAAAAEARSCAFLDARVHIASSDVDGVHLEAEGHALLGKAVAAAVLDCVRD
jgi:lysophospholipase L1-like esterase